MREIKLPGWLLHPPVEFSDAFKQDIERGREILSRSRVAVTGLARDCEGPLRDNLVRAAAEFRGLSKHCRLHVLENDSVDGTKAALSEFCREHADWASFQAADYGRARMSNAFAGPRTVALAEYRQECVRWVATGDWDYVVLIDWDAWGGWSPAGVLSGFSRIEQEDNAFGMASVSLLEHPSLTLNKENQVVTERKWLHYDCWALRLNCYTDDYSAGFGAWKHGWLPFVGSPPIPVCSAFGGLCIYRAEDFLKGSYDGSDCEHVTFHASIASQTGKQIYLNPSQRTVMQWMLEGEPNEQEGGTGLSLVSG